MFKFIFLCIILFTGQQYVAGVLSPSYEYVPDADTWLRLQIVPATWQNARRRCYLEGGILATPSSETLTKAMLSMMLSHKVNRPVFTGIHDLISEDDFMSLDGIPLESIYLDWAQGKPDARNDGGNCLVLNPIGDVSDVGCASAHPYFCRKDNFTMDLSLDCRTTSGYEYFDRTGSCYKFHRQAMTWRRAASVCHAEGGHLAVINSDAEAELIKEIFKNNPVNTVVGSKHDDVAFVGFWKWDDKDREWLTIHGQTLKDAGYEQWGKGQPNNYGGVQTVGSIQRGGGFDDIAHYDSEPFICEITLNHVSIDKKIDTKILKPNTNAIA